MYNDKLAVSPSGPILTSHSREPCFPQFGPSGLLNDAHEIDRWILIGLNIGISRSETETTRPPGESRSHQSYCSLHP